MPVGSVVLFGVTFIGRELHETSVMQRISAKVAFIFILIPFGGRFTFAVTTFYHINDEKSTV